MWQGAVAAINPLQLNQITLICLALFFPTPALIWNAFPEEQGCCCGVAFSRR